MRKTVAALAKEAEQQIHDQVWELAGHDRALAIEAEAGLRKAVGAAPAQEALPHIDRLEDLREALAVLALCLARTHGRLAWFLSSAITALEPVLRWRTLSAGRGGTFGTAEATPEQYADAEEAVRLITDTLAMITTESGAR